eukprot:9504409-Prorocentrum_lima.AAC.1
MCKCSTTRQTSALTSLAKARDKAQSCSEETESNRSRSHCRAAHNAHKIEMEKLSYRKKKRGELKQVPGEQAVIRMQLEKLAAQ